MGSAPAGRPTIEDRQHSSAEPSKQPDIPVVTDPAIVAAVEAASEADRLWFKRHPDRAHRLRRVYPGELTHVVGERGTSAIMICVKQVAVGCRVKVGFRGFDPLACRCEECAARSWDLHAHEKAKAMALDMAGIVMRHRP